MDENQEAVSTKAFELSAKQMYKMMEMGAVEYAHREAWDISAAAQAIGYVASMLHDEIEEADDVQSLANIITSLLEFINGEVKDLVAHAKGATSKSVKPAEPKNEPVTETELNLSYVKSLGLETIPELAVKFVARDEIKGYSILWGDPLKVDLEKEYFTKDTNFWDLAPHWLTWDHAQDEQFKSDPRIGEILEVGDDEWGKWYVARLKRAEAYRKYLDMLIEGKKVGSSSDSAPQYVKRERTGKSIWLKEWPLFAVSLTDNPCEPRMIGSIDFLKSLDVTLPEVPVEAWEEQMATLKLYKAKYLLGA